MVSKHLLFLLLLAVALVVFQTGSLANAEDTESSSSARKPLVKIVKGKKLCDKGWECKGWSEYCCKHTISDFFDTYQFENLFSKRNSPVAHAVIFWDYRSFINAAAEYQPLGFGTAGDKLQGMKEVAAFLGHVGSKLHAVMGLRRGGPLAWGLCYNKEMSPDKLYCDEYYKLTFPCTPGVSYHGRGALPVYWNYNYGQTGEALKVDLLSHPEYLENNATLAFQAAIWRWMTPAKKHVPSAHDVFVGKWKPTKNDTEAKRTPGFGATINVLHGDQMCNSGFDNDETNNIVSHYLYYLDLMGVGREEAGPHETLSFADQEPFSSSSSSAPPSSGSSS